MSWESPFLRLSSALNEIGQKNFPVQQQTISNQKNVVVLRALPPPPPLELLKKQTKNDSTPKIFEKPNSLWQTWQ